MVNYPFPKTVCGSFRLKRAILKTDGAAIPVFRAVAAFLCIKIPGAIGAKAEKSTPFLNIKNPHRGDLLLWGGFSRCSL